VHSDQAVAQVEAALVALPALQVMERAEAHRLASVELLASLAVEPVEPDRSSKVH
jgi:hypothetical protein